MLIAFSLSPRFHYVRLEPTGGLRLRVGGRGSEGGSEVTKSVSGEI